MHWVLLVSSAIPQPFICIPSDTYRIRLLNSSRIPCYVKACIIDQAVKLFKEMTQSNCRVFCIDYNRFIGVLVRYSRFDLAENYYCKMMPQGFSLTPFTHLRFIAALCLTRMRDFRLIEKLVKDMDKLQCVPWHLGVQYTFELFVLWKLIKIGNASVPQNGWEGKRAWRCHIHSNDWWAVQN